MPIGDRSRSLAMMRSRAAALPQPHPTAAAPYRSHVTSLGDFRGGFLSLNVSLTAIKTGDKNE
jgi:hypothetical protein